MPTFSTPEPISATVEVAVGDVRITATERDDTVVHVRASDPAREADSRAAEQTVIEYAAGHLRVKTLKQSGLGLFGKVGSVDITIDLPTGSSLHGRTAMAAFRSTGSLGRCEMKSAAGDIELEATAALDLMTGAGTVVVDRVLGDVTIKTGAGKVRIAHAGGNVQVKNGNGDSWFGEVAGDLRISAANGDVTIDRALASVSVSTANGDVRIREAARGSASLKSGHGEIEIGIRAGTAARLDLSTGFGAVRNQLSATDSPEATDETLDVRARTGYGDIVIRRA